MAEKNKPVKKVRSGNIQAAIWRNEADGVAHYNVTLSRSYKTEDGEWRDTDSFSAYDLPTVEKVVGLAWYWIHCQREKERAEAERDE